MGISNAECQKTGAAARSTTDPIGEQALNTRITTPNFPGTGRCIGVLLGLGLCSLVSAGTLSLGKPVVQNNQYTFPVNLQGDAEGVAALDFRLSYDPAVFSPVSATTGNSAVTAQKQVSSNVTEPGEFVVVMMGFNQNEVQPGTVVELVLEKIGEPASGQSELLIAEPTMATYEGVELDSSGQARVVRFGEDKTEDDTPEEPAPVEEDTETKTPPEPESGGLNPEARPAGGFRVLVAEETEYKKQKGPAAQEPSGGSAAAPSPTQPKDAVASASGNGDATGEAPSTEASSGATPGDRSPMTAASDPDLGSVGGGGGIGSAGDATLAMGGGAPLNTPPLPEGESGNRGLLFATLLLVVVALPVSGFFLLKLLR